MSLIDHERKKIFEKCWKRTKMRISYNYENFGMNMSNELEAKMLQEAKEYMWSNFAHKCHTY